MQLAQVSFYSGINCLMPTSGLVHFIAAKLLIQMLVGVLTESGLLPLKNAQDSQSLENASKQKLLLI